MAAATVANHIATSTVSPQPVVGMTTGEVNAAHTVEAVAVTTDIHKKLTPAVAAKAITTAFLINNNNTNIENMKRDEYTESSTSNSISSSIASISPMGTPTQSSKVVTTPTLIHPQTPNLPPVAMPGPLNCEGDTESANGIATGGVSMASIQLVDNSTQTDIRNEEEEETLTDNVEFEVNAEVESEHLRQIILTVPQNREKNHKFTKIHKENDQDIKVSLTTKRQNGIEKSIPSCSENVLQAKLITSEASSASEKNRLECFGNNVFSDKQANGISESITDIDNYSIATSVVKSSVDEKTFNKLKNSKLSSEYGEYEPVDCICNAATQFDCDCDEAAANCTYQERIIDYDNFRIIEHVIDCAHESYCNHNDAWKTNYEENIDESKDMNFACRELVAFIGESYQIIDNAQRSLMQAQEQTENSKGEGSDPRIELSCSVKDVEDKDIYIKDLRASNILPVEKVDDNNNKDRATSAIHLLGGSDDTNKTNSNKTLKTSTIAVTNSVSSPIRQRAKPDQRWQKTEETTSTMQLPPPSVALALKALKSKLTPLAPSFHPARKKISNTSSATATSAAATSSMYAYEQTAVYYQQQPQPQPPPPKQQQQQLLQHATTTTMLHTMSLHQHSRAQQDKQQSPQVSPMSQQSYSKGTFQHQRKQQQSLQQVNNFVASSATHQQHCAQHGNPLGGMPHIHLHSAGGSAAIPNGASLTTGALPVAVGNASQQAQLYPLHLISLAGSGAVASTGNSSAGAATQQQQPNTTSAVGNGPMTWPLLEATPIFIDGNGEFRTFCPTHGPPALNPTATVGAANSNGIQFSHSTATNLALENISQHSQSQHYKHSSQHHQMQLLSTLPVPSSTPILSAPALSTNATNRQLSHQQQQKHQVQTKNQNHNKNHHQQPHHQLLQQHQNLETSNGTLQISGKGKPYRGE